MDLKLGLDCSGIWRVRLFHRFPSDVLNFYIRMAMFELLAQNLC